MLNYENVFSSFDRLSDLDSFWYALHRKKNALFSLFSVILTVRRRLFFERRMNSRRLEISQKSKRNLPLAANFLSHKKIKAK